MRLSVQPELQLWNLGASESWKGRIMHQSCHCWWLFRKPHKIEQRKSFVSRTSISQKTKSHISILRLPLSLCSELLSPELCLVPASSFCTRNWGVTSMSCNFSSISWHVCIPPAVNWAWDPFSDVWGWYASNTFLNNKECFTIFSGICFSICCLWTVLISSWWDDTLSWFGNVGLNWFVYCWCKISWCKKHSSFSLIH